MLTGVFGPCLQNQAAMDIQCQICKSTFLKTTKAPEYVLTPLTKDDAESH